MRRISVVGCSGSGKSTVGEALALALDVPHLELDSIRHQANWQELPNDEFAARVGAFVAGEAWVVDGNYSVVREPLVWPRADTIVWLDLPKAVVTLQIVSRSLWRVVLRKELWNGNRESWRNLLAWEPERSIIRWSWTSYDRVQQRYTAAIEDPRWAHAQFVRVRSRREVARLLQTATRMERP